MQGNDDNQQTTALNRRRARYYVAHCVFSGSTGHWEKNRWLAGYREGEMDNGEKNGRSLFGQDQLVFAGHAQQIELPPMVDFQRGCALQQRSAIDAGALGRRRRGGGLNRNGGVGLFHFNANTNENGSHSVVNENRCQRDFWFSAGNCCIRTNLEMQTGSGAADSSLKCRHGVYRFRQGGVEFPNDQPITKVMVLA